MAITSRNRNHGRQYPVVASQPFSLSELTHATAVAAVKIPAGARVLGGGVLVTTAFDASGNVLDVGDGGDPNRYTASAVDLTALGYTALTVTGFKYTTSDYVDLVWTKSGTPTTGTGVLFVEYIVDGRQNEVNPDYD